MSPLCGFGDAAAVSFAVLEAFLLGLREVLFKSLRDCRRFGGAAGCDVCHAEGGWGWCEDMAEGIWECSGDGLSVHGGTWSWCEGT